MSTATAFRSRNGKTYPIANAAPKGAVNQRPMLLSTAKPPVQPPPAPQNPYDAARQATAFIRDIREFARQKGYRLSQQDAVAVAAIMTDPDKQYHFGEFDAE